MTSSDSSNSNEMVPLPGSERTPLRGARAVGPADPNQQISITVVLKSAQTTSATFAPHLAAATEELAARARRTSRAESLAAAEAMFGSSPADIARVKEYAEKNGLEIGKVTAAANTVELTGTVARMSEAFGVTLERYAQEGSKLVYRGRTGPVFLPRNLVEIVEAVLGLDDRPQTSPKFQI